MFTSQNNLTLATKEKNASQKELFESNVHEPNYLLDVDLFKFERVEDLFGFEENGKKCDHKSMTTISDLVSSTCITFDVTQKQDVKSDRILYNDCVKGLKLDAGQQVKNPCKVASIAPFSFEFEFENNVEEIQTQPSTQDTIITLQDMIQNLTIGTNEFKDHLLLTNETQKKKHAAPSKRKLQKRSRCSDQDRDESKLQMDLTFKSAIDDESKEILNELQTGLKKTSENTPINIGLLAKYSSNKDNCSTSAENVSQESVPRTASTNSDLGMESKVMKTCLDKNIQVLHLQENAEKHIDGNEELVSSDTRLETTPCEKQNWKRQKRFSDIKTGSTAVFTCTPLHRRLADEFNIDQ